MSNGPDLLLHIASVIYRAVKELFSWIMTFLFVAGGLVAGMFFLWAMEKHTVWLARSAEIEQTAASITSTGLVAALWVCAAIYYAGKKIAKAIMFRPVYIQVGTCDTLQTLNHEGNLFIVSEGELINWNRRQRESGCDRK